MGSLCVNFRRTVVPLIAMRRNSFCVAEAQTMRPGYLKHDRRAGTCAADHYLELCSEKRPGIKPGPSSFRLRVVLIIHTTHATHATARHSRGPTVFLRPFGDHGFCGDQKTGDRCCILQGRPNNLGRVNNALGDEVYILAVLGVKAVGVLILLEDLADDDGTVLAGVDGDLARRSGQRLAHDLDAMLLVLVGRVHFLERFSGAQQRDAAAG